MPAAPDPITFVVVEGLQAEVRERLVQRAAVDIVHVERRPGLADDAFHGPPTPAVDHLMPVGCQVMDRADGRHRGDESAVPVQHRASCVEGQGLDVHRLLHLRWDYAGHLLAETITRQPTSGRV